MNHLRTHLEGATTQLPEQVIAEVCAMYQEGASNILTALTDLDPKIRDTVLEALSAYHQAFDNNNAVVEQVAKVLLRGNTQEAANDGKFALTANA